MPWDPQQHWRHGEDDDDAHEEQAGPEALRRLLSDLHEKGVMQALWDVLARDQDACLAQLHALVAEADQAGWGTEVEPIVDQVLEAMPDAALFWVYKSNLRIGAADWEGAEEASRRATELDPRDADGWLNLGIAAYELHDHEAAANYYEISQALEPRAETLMEMGINLFHMGERADGLKRLDEAYKETPTDPKIVETYGWHLYYAGLYARALAVLEEAAAVWPSQAKIRLFAALASAALGQADKAAELLRPLVPELLAGRLKKDLTGFGLFALLRTRRVDDALQVITAYERHPEMNDTFYYYAAAVLTAAGRNEEAANHLRQALEVDSGWVRESMRTDPDLEPLRAADPNLFA